MKKHVLASMLFSCALVASTSAYAAPDLDAAINAGSFTEVQKMVSADPSLTDRAVRSLLQFTQTKLTANPDHSSLAMTLASSFAPKISPANVPPVCADVRRIVAALPAESVGSALFTSVVAASEAFAKAPVVVAAGRPKLCEEAWIDAANRAGDNALLAEIPGYNPPSYPPIIVKPSGD